MKVFVYERFDDSDRYCFVRSAGVASKREAINMLVRDESSFGKPPIWLTIDVQVNHKTMNVVIRRQMELIEMLS